MVKYPLARDILRREFEILLVIKIPANLIFLPFNGIHMKIVPEGVCRSCDACPYTISTGISGRMDRGIDVIGFSPYMLHNVDLAGGRPSLMSNVLSKHPKSGPDSLSIGKLEARFDPPILPGMQPLRLDPCRRIGPSTDLRFLLAGFDDEHSIFQTHIFGAIS